MRLRRIRRDEDAVSAVIGTIMALMVFLAFMGIITNYYVPVWMEENESNHMSEAQRQFGNLKSTIDTQVAVNERNMTFYSPIKLGSEGVPVFADATNGKLELAPHGEQFNIRFDDSSSTVNVTSKGRLRLVVPNRYYVRQSLVYSNGGLVVWQENGMFFKVRPHFQVQNQSGNVTISQSLISLISLEDEGVPGVGLVGVNTNLLYTDSWTYTNITGNVSFNITSDYADAWEEFFDTTFQANSVLDYVLTLSDLDGDGRNDFLNVIISNVTSYQLKHAYVRTYLGDESVRQV